MNSGLDASDPTLVRAFRSALLHQWGIVAAIFLLLLVVYATARNWRPAPAPAPEPNEPDEPDEAKELKEQKEPKPRRLLRSAFGFLWLFDGILQAQPRMVSGLPSQVIAPAAESSPRWVQDVVNTGGTVWSFHPVQAAAAAVWIQAGLGLWLIVAKEGWWSRLAGMASAAWGLVVWVFGEAFAAIFAPGLSWLTGAPGAVLLYVAAGALIALPPRAWTGPRVGRAVLAGTGAFWAGMALLQGWPGRGFWQGGDSGTLAGMVHDMAASDQPHAQAAMVSAFASFAAAHGFAVNLFAVIALGSLGLGLLGLGLLALAVNRGRRRLLLRAAVAAAVVFCLADWALIQDFGIPGGLGTDPNSMAPWVILLCAGHLAVTQEKEISSERPVAPHARPRSSIASVRAALRPAALRPSALRAALRPSALRAALRPSALRAAVACALAMASARSVTALGAVGVVMVGAAPMAVASADQNADPIIARAVAGASVPADRPAPGFELASQSGRAVSLSSLRGRVVLLTFLDPVCAECRTIARELEMADGLLGPSGRDVVLVAIAADSVHSDPVFIRAFNRRAGLAAVPDWLFLTGPPAPLQQVRTWYETIAPHMMSGMTARGDIIFVIDKAGRIRQEIKDDPGPATTSTQSSFATLIRDAARHMLNS